ncbi:MAG: HAD family hydrolase [Spirochaetales bacterium]|nr:HAD family hydrolase [Spirochaetales bacterium]
MGSLVFLDFDGVICDSAAECFASSWEACFGRPHTEIPPAQRDQRMADFLRLRPYVRSGEDFMICQEILYKGLAVDSQADFDALAADKGAAEMARLRDRFYAARGALLRRDRAYWMRLNSLYPEMAAHLPQWAGHPGLFILSTKRSEFIAEILASAGIGFPLERILHADKSGKGRRLHQVLNRWNPSSALLVDDQIDHLLAIRQTSDRVALYLAAWGYVKPEWLESSPVPVVTLAQLPALVTGALEA